MQLRFFYDGSCPLCHKEINHLKKLDTESLIEFFDIHEPEFSERFPHIPFAEANRILHGESPDGRVLKGLDVTYEAWSLVGKRHYVAILRWPLVRHFANWLYHRFANNRFAISYLLSGQSRCKI